MSTQLAGQCSRGEYRLTPFAGVLIEPLPPAARRGREKQVISQEDFDTLRRLMPDLDPELIRGIMGVEVLAPDAE
ncbi:hypothetical protein ABJI51_16790 [Amycolatopsis sp. NEAU-NG30]|uniref:Uncharacterized protein n=1 Tax=Amycolatopsis melonis TaxID=3156488 RepID=A0ABV0LEL3_9PSEU